MVMVAVEPIQIITETGESTATSKENTDIEPEGSWISH